MKIHFLTVLAFSVGVNHCVQGQTAWELVGNSVLGTDFLGTTNTQPLFLRTANTGTPQSIIFQTNGATERMRITGDGSVGIGTNSPSSLFHLYQNNTGVVLSRFGNTNTGATATDGTTLGIQGNGAFRVTQFENQNTSIFTPSNTVPGTQVERFRVAPNGQVFIGTFGFTPDIVNDNIIDGVAIGGFSNPDSRSSLLNVRGPIYSSYPVNGDNPIATILYSMTNSNDTPPVGADGFRMKVNRNFFETNADALVFEKTDGNQLVDGGIAFTNTGGEDPETPSFYIRGTGRTYVGKNILPTPQMTNRFTIDSEPTDASPSGLRFIDLTSTATPGPNPGTGVLSVDVDGNVIYVEEKDKGTFAECSDMTGATNLTADSKLNLNDNNLYFENNNVLGENHIGIGYDCSEVLPGKLSTLQIHPQTVSTNTTAVHTVNKDLGNVLELSHTGTYSEVSGVQNPAYRIKHIGGDFKVTNATNNYAIIGEVLIPNTVTLPIFSNNVGADLNVIGPGLNNRGAEIEVRNATSSNLGISAFAVTETQNGFTSSSNIGGSFTGRNAQNTNQGISAVAEGGTICIGTLTGATTTATGGSSFGVYSRAAGQGGALSTPTTHPGSVAIGVYSHTDPVTGSLTGYAGFFDGNVHASGQVTSTNGTITVSDQQFKENVSDITGASSLINALQPRYFSYDTVNYSDFRFETDVQMGLIAQEVELVIPEIVSNHVYPAQYDSLGTIISPEINYKAVEYEELISLLIAGQQEQNAEIDSLKEQNQRQQNQIDDLNDKMNFLLNCLQTQFPDLCEMEQESIQRTSPEAQEQLKNQRSVILSNRNTIVLNQNVPNPFAESTVITYSIPASVKTAQIVFYDAVGALIKTVDITERGNGQINVYAQDLSSGAYTYSLVADEKIVATKRMVKQ